MRSRLEAVAIPSPEGFRRECYKALGTPESVQGQLRGPQGSHLLVRLATRFLAASRGEGIIQDLRPYNVPTERLIVRFCQRLQELLFKIRRGALSLGRTLNGVSEGSFQA